MFYFSLFVVFCVCTEEIRLSGQTETKEQPNSEALQRGGGGGGGGRRGERTNHLVCCQRNSVYGL